MAEAELQDAAAWYDERSPGLVSGSFSRSGRDLTNSSITGNLNVVHMRPSRVVSFAIEGRGRSRQYFYRTPDGEETILFEGQTPRDESR
jgi:hypothetical protein